MSRPELVKVCKKCASVYRDAENKDRVCSGDGGSHEPESSTVYQLHMSMDGTQFAVCDNCGVLCKGSGNCCEVSVDGHKLKPGTLSAKPGPCSSENAFRVCGVCGSLFSPRTTQKCVGAVDLTGTFGTPVARMAGSQSSGVSVPPSPPSGKHSPADDICYVLDLEK